MLAGLVNGITTWALLFLLWITAVIFGTANLMGAAQQGANGTAGGGFTLATWTGFWSLLVGLVLTAVGGILGGRMRPDPSSWPSKARPSNRMSRGLTAIPVVRAGRGLRRERNARPPSSVVPAR